MANRAGPDQTAPCRSSPIRALTVCHFFHPSASRFCGASSEVCGWKPVMFG